MRVEMLEGEREILREMLGGEITPAVASLFFRMREMLLKVGHSYMMPKENLAMIAILGKAVGGAPVEAADVIEPERIETTELQTITPDDELTQSEVETIEQRNREYAMNGDATGGSYTGSRIKWDSDEKFKSTPRTPIAKLEKGRPITYISPKDNARRAGRFVRINSTDKSMCNVISSEMKKAFAVPIKNVAVTDLSPPSTEPLAVQI